MADGEFHHRDRCAIVGIGATDFSRDSGRSDLTLATAGVAGRDRRRRPDAAGHRRHRALRHGPRPPQRPRRRARHDAASTTSARSDPAASPRARMVGQAVAAILSGQATTVLVFRVAERPLRPPLRPQRRDRARGSAATAPTTSSSCRTACSRRARSSPSSPSATCSSTARREKDLGHIAVACRDRANANPAAQMHDRPLTMDDYLAARMISPAAAAVRLLPRDRRRLRGRRHEHRAGPGPAPSRRR